MLLCQSAYSQEDIVFNGLHFSYNKTKFKITENKVEVRGVTRRDTAIIIPSTVKNSHGIQQDVKNIGMSAFRQCHFLKRITIPNSITYIDWDAFYKCESLTSLVIPDSVRYIGTGAFNYCSSLTSISIPNSIITFGDGPIFEKCDKLQYNEYNNALYLGNQDNPYVVLIKAKSKDISSCVINENCKCILSEAFSGCTDLTNISIPNNITCICSNAFEGCNNLQYNEYNNALYLGSQDNPYAALIKAKSTNIIRCRINTDCKTISSSAFKECNKLTNV